ncbi:TPA: hypothetical protein OZO91_004544 [Escherichia coli]|nr:hypothetical protein [Escherichia coli]
MEKRQRRSLWKNASGGAYGKTPAAQPMEKRQRRSLSLPFAFLLTCSFRPYPLILWITVLQLLSELTPLAAAERPSVASQ